MDINIKSLSAEQREHLKKQLDEFENCSSEFKKGEQYWVLDDSGDTTFSYWNNDECDNFRLNTMNAFKTREEVEQKQKELQALARVNKYIRENDMRIKDVDWSDIQSYKWYIGFDHDNEELIIYCQFYYNSKPLIGELKSEEDCKKLIKDMKEDLLIIFKK